MLTNTKQTTDFIPIPENKHLKQGVFLTDGVRGQVVPDSRLVTAAFGADGLEYRPDTAGVIERGLMHEDGLIRLRTVLAIRRDLMHRKDITALLPSIERMLRDELPGVRIAAATTLGLYGILVYRLDIISGWPELREIISEWKKSSVHLPVEVLRPNQEQGPYPVSPLLLEYEPSAGEAAERPLSVPPEVAPLDLMKRTAPFIEAALLSDMLTRLCQTDKSTPPECRERLLLYEGDFCNAEWSGQAKVFRSFWSAAGILAAVFILFFVGATESSKAAGNYVSYQDALLKPAELTSAVQYSGIGQSQLPESLARPDYLSAVAAGQMPYLDAESLVFDEIRDFFGRKPEFVRWFNGLHEDRKRGFILFVWSKALSEYLGETESFSAEQWSVKRPQEVRGLMKSYLNGERDTDIIEDFRELDVYCEIKRSLFLSRNEWLKDYLGGNYEDLKAGLFYFFMEHDSGITDVGEISARFHDLRPQIERASEAIVSSRDRNTRISPKAGVSDTQIREIVSASFFTELFYGSPAGFITLISGYETNFSMEYGVNGYGTTQQTTRSANTVLHSDFWLKQVEKASGVKIRFQMVTMHSLRDNVFLCIAEAAKTVAIKAAELGIRTCEIDPDKNISFSNSMVPATWALAYKYNGSSFSREYAEEMDRFYRLRTGWLGAFVRPEKKDTSRTPWG